jgi:hypothetical protein
MAHIQYNGTRISGQTRYVSLGQSLLLELWGPKKPAGGQYLMIASDSTAVTVEPGALVGGRNVQLYKFKGTAFSSHIKIEIIDGALVEGAKTYTRDNVVKPYISCDYVNLTVEPGGGKVIFGDYFDEVIPAIAAGIAEYNSSNSPQLIDKAGFLLVQTYSEQSPGVTGKPSKHGNRMFNVQALVAQGPNGKVGGTLPGQEEAGVTIRSLSQGEGATVETRKMLSSPTFYYDTQKRAVTHYLKILKQRYTGALTAITDPSGSFSRFADALQAAGYATHKAYAEDMKAIAGQVLRQANAWLDFELKALDHDIAVADLVESDGLKQERSRLTDFKLQLSRFKP